MIETILKRLNNTDIPIKIWYGNVITGKSRTKNSRVIGQMLSHNVILTKRGGFVVFPNQIVKIDNLRTKSALYTHPKFHIN